VARAHGLLEPSGRLWARLLTGLRVLIGVQFVVVGLVPKFVFQDATAASFDRWGVPAADLIVYAVGLVEVVGGMALVAGWRTRLTAFVLTVDMAGALGTAGRVDGGIHLIAPPLLAALLILIAVAAEETPPRRPNGGRERAWRAESDPALKMTALAARPSSIIVGAR